MDEIVTHELPRDFDSLVELPLRVEGRLQRHHQWRTARPSRTLDEGGFQFCSYLLTFCS